MTVPHFAFPFRFAEGGVPRTVEQDTLEEIEQGVKVLVLTQKGERLEVPDFGIDDPTFRNEIDLQSVHEAAQEWDERVDLVLAEQAEGRIRHLLIQVTEEE